ncbi:Fic family protein [Leifsonia sp. H3M29-4]|uniref:Fic family protein n=1 Tax=Salinibacterium metalliresistens TaxID=3031321 RepID=UPI0023DCB16E|nr:Fic family protein [Salinibacterium metalliresistens]MDF1478118.1 Fic family protein [Salinibacterium metalliresistens]
MSDSTSNTSESLSWPALGSEQHQWASRINSDHLTRAQRERIRQPYSSAIVPPIANLSIDIPGDLAAEIDEATQLLTRFDAEVGPGGLPFASILLRTESASSSEIENLTSGARAIAEAELGERETGNAALIVRNVRTMEAALALADKIDGESIIAMQTALLGSHAPDLTGRWRDEQVWVGGDSLSPHLADFVPPHHNRVPAAIDDLVAFIDRTDIPALAQVAIAHAQFETIHPFPDGNGRTGRAIVQAMLRQARVTTNITVPVSAGLLHDVKDYYNALSAYRRGELRPIVTAFTRATGYAVVNGRQLVGDIKAIEAEWEVKMSGLRSDATARRVGALAIAHPVLNSDIVVRELGVAPPTAFRALDALIERGLLASANSQRRNRIWLAESVLRTLDDFASRAGRRGR